MALNYYSKFGSYVCTETDVDGVTHQYTEDIHNANCMCCGVYHFSEDGKNHARVMWYFDDTTDMRTCVKAGQFKNCDNFTFEADKMTPDAWHLIKALAKLGKHITIN